MLLSHRNENDPLNDLVKEYLNGRQRLIGIEIGSYRGESAEIFLKSNAFFRLYCIDPWEPGYDPNDGSASEDIRLAEKDFDQRFKNNQTIVKIRQTASASVGLFDDNSIDFVYIDGNHQYEFIKNDIINYFPKIKHGGILSGHDYGRPSVARAINEIFKTAPLRVYKEYSWVYVKA